MDVLQVLKKYGTEIKYKGNSYLIPCLNPEHDDKDPSLRIDKNSGSMHCFSCGFKGNIFTYYGIITNYSSIRIKKLKEKLLKVKADMTGLDIPAHSMQWTKEFRGVSAETMKAFGAFYNNTVPEMLGRVVFPVRDISGKIQVFMGRHTMSDEHPKYVAYPRHIPLPMYPAKVPDSFNSIVIVEGIMDMLKLYDNGLRNVVTSWGTSTLIHKAESKLLFYKMHGIKKIFILYDSDVAGVKAAKQLESVIQESQSLDLDVEVLPLEEGDPGTMSKEDINILKEYIEEYEESCYN